MVARNPALSRDPRIVVQETVERLGSSGVPATVAEEVAINRPVADATLAALTEPQRQDVLRAQIEAAARSARASLRSSTSGTTFFHLALWALASAIVGALLVRKQPALQCTNCGVIHLPGEA